MDSGAPSTLHQGIGLDHRLEKPRRFRSCGISRTKLYRNIDYLHTGAAGRIEQPGGLAQHVVCLDHGGKSEVFECPVFVD